MIGFSIDGLKHPRFTCTRRYKSCPELKTRLQTVDAEKAKLDRRQQRPLPPNTVASLREKS